MVLRMAIRENYQNTPNVGCAKPPSSNSPIIGSLAERNFKAAYIRAFVVVVLP